MAARLGRSAHRSADARQGKSGSCLLEQLPALFLKKTREKKQGNVEQQPAVLEPPAHRPIVSSSLSVRCLISDSERRWGIGSVFEMSWFARSLGMKRVGEFLPVTVIQSFPIRKGGGKELNLFLKWKKEKRKYSACF